MESEVTYTLDMVEIRQDTQLIWPNLAFDRGKSVLDHLHSILVLRISPQI